MKIPRRALRGDVETKWIETGVEDADDDDFDSTNLPRSASIDSIVETKHCVSSLTSTSTLLAKHHQEDENSTSYVV
ncbi:hypothetical protein V9T40_014775 [Parthenolecanium corni]|uniref:Uncharacterized protein n=1 Tax=Parthenolecanium corni TaxID=536013 RepID=A0AAN9T2R9_9HEMI